eukprot:885354-Prymnesium_polylepis.1
MKEACTRRFVTKKAEVPFFASEQPWPPPPDACTVGGAARRAARTAARAAARDPREAPRPAACGPQQHRRAAQGATAYGAAAPRGGLLRRRVGRAHGLPAQQQPELAHPRPACAAPVDEARGRAAVRRREAGGHAARRRDAARGAAQRARADRVRQAVADGGGAARHGVDVARALDAQG